VHSLKIAAWALLAAVKAACNASRKSHLPSLGLPFSLVERVAVLTVMVLGRFWGLATAVGMARPAHATNANKTTAKKDKVTFERVKN
jgi:hypothetical protein